MSTLVEYFKASKDPMSKGFVGDLLRFSDLLGVVPIDDVEGLKVSGNRWQTLPTSAFRRLNGAYTASAGTLEEVEDTVAILGGEVKLDRILTKAKNYHEDPLITQTRMLAKSVAFNFNHYFVNGDLAVDPDGFEGIRKRVSNMPNRMTISLTPGSNDCLKVFASDANQHLFLDALDQAIKYVDGATHILMNENTWLKIGSVLRRQSTIEFNTRRNEFGKMIKSYGGVDLVDVGLKSDKSTEIITNTEDPGDGGNDSTSIYVVRMDTDDGLHAIQLSGTSPDVYDPIGGKESESSPAFLRRVDWGIGLYNLSQYCICRIKDFKMAAA